MSMFPNEYVVAVLYLESILIVCVKQHFSSCYKDSINKASWSLVGNNVKAFLERVRNNICVLFRQTSQNNPMNFQASIK